MPTRPTPGDATSPRWSSIPTRGRSDPFALTAVTDVGKAIHPALARGQIEGGTAQGLGYALLERVTMQNGVMANAQLTNYLIPTTLDTPKLDVVLLEHPYAGGPFGAKGLGELPIDGPAPAVVNAIRHMGLDVTEIPAVPEAIRGGRVRFTLNGRETEVDAHPHGAPARRAAGGLRTHRHEGGVRRGRVRGVHGADRRGGGLLLPGAVRAGRRRRGHDDRRTGRRAPAATRVHGRSRRAVRDLHAGHDPRRALDSAPARSLARSGRGSPAISAAARATRRSTARSSRDGGPVITRTTRMRANAASRSSSSTRARSTRR